VTTYVFIVEYESHSQTVLEQIEMEHFFILCFMSDFFNK